MASIDALHSQVDELVTREGAMPTDADLRTIIKPLYLGMNPTDRGALLQSLGIHPDSHDTLLRRTASLERPMPPLPAIDDVVTMYKLCFLADLHGSQSAQPGRE